MCVIFLTEIPGESAKPVKNKIKKVGVLLAMFHSFINYFGSWECL